MRVDRGLIRRLGVSEEEDGAGEPSRLWNGAVGAAVVAAAWGFAISGSAVGAVTVGEFWREAVRDRAWRKRSNAGSGIGGGSAGRVC